MDTGKRRSKLSEIIDEQIKKSQHSTECIDDVNLHESIDCIDGVEYFFQREWREIIENNRIAIVRSNLTSRQCNICGKAFDEDSKFVVDVNLGKILVSHYDCFHPISQQKYEELKLRYPDFSEDRLISLSRISKIRINNGYYGHSHSDSIENLPISREEFIKYFSLDSQIDRETIELWENREKGKIENSIVKMLRRLKIFKK